MENAPLLPRGLTHSITHSTGTSTEVLQGYQIDPGRATIVGKFQSLDHASYGSDDTFSTRHTDDADAIQLPHIIVSDVPK